MLQKWREFWGTGFSREHDLIPQPDISQQMERASALSLSYCLMLALAAVIATLGLISNSPPAIIGAMIIAPLMSPIMSLSYGLVSFDTRLIARSALTVTVGVILVVVIGYIITSVFGLKIAGSEILGRKSPTLIDLGVALAAGGAAAFANTRRSILNSIAGVAIAVALVPPLAVSGIGLALGQTATMEPGISISEFGDFSGSKNIAAGAFLLFLTNFIGIVSVAVFVFICQRIGEWKKASVALVLCVGLSALLFQPLSDELHKLYIKHKVTRLVSMLAIENQVIVKGTGRLDAVHVWYVDDLLHVNLDGYITKDQLVDVEGEPNLKARLERFRDLLSEDIGEQVVVGLDVIPVDVVQIEVGPPSD